MTNMKEIMQSPDKQKNLDNAGTIRAHENSEQKRAKLEREHTRFSPLATSEPQNTSKQDNTSQHTLEAKFEAALDQVQLEIERTHFSIPSYEKQREIQCNIQRKTFRETLRSAKDMKKHLMGYKNDDHKKVHNLMIDY